MSNTTYATMALQTILNRACCSLHAQKLQGGPGMAASILGSLRSAASGGAVKQAESSGHVVAGQHFQEIQQSSSKLFSLFVWRFQCAPDVFNALERIGWILKESPKFTMVQQVK